MKMDAPDGPVHLFFAVRKRRIARATRRTAMRKETGNTLYPLVNQPRLELLAREFVRDRSPKSILLLRPAAYTRRN
jgi:hypothetical protein